MQVQQKRWLRKRLWCAALFVACIPGCSCYHAPPVSPGQRGPLPGTLVMPIPSAVVSATDTITRTQMQNVNFHVDDDIQLRIRILRGRLEDLTGHHIAVLDDKKGLLINIAYAEVGLTAEHMTLLLNRYVFNYKGSPLKGLVVRTEGDHIVQTGVMHKIIDIPFEMSATLSAEPDGRIRIHSTSMKICGLNGKALLRAVDKTLEDMLDLSGARGVTVEKNDLLLDPVKILPPPAIKGHLTAVRVEGNEIVQTFGAPTDGMKLQLPIAISNYMYFRGGTMRFGKLFMVATDLLTADGDQSDWFDMYIDYYHAQLVAGYHLTTQNYGLIAFMPDFNDLGTPKGRLVPNTIITDESAVQLTSRKNRQ